VVIEGRKFFTDRPNVWLNPDAPSEARANCTDGDSEWAKDTLDTGPRTRAAGVLRYLLCGEQRDGTAAARRLVSGPRRR
jgi:hypothetical protein